MNPLSSMLEKKLSGLDSSLAVV
ncbi:MAG: hypothetical protein JWP52_3690, partial [Rhizobacter sp.]|nr:hypothetical protein [Rhizobacter sp.]